MTTVPEYVFRGSVYRHVVLAEQMPEEMFRGLTWRFTEPRKVIADGERKIRLEVVD